ILMSGLPLAGKDSWIAEHGENALREKCSRIAGQGEDAQEKRTGIGRETKAENVAGNGRKTSEERLLVISLDDIREELRIPPAKKSDQIARIATERAKDCLRQRRAFIWNATNIVRETRQRLIDLFAGYGARVHIRYLEAPYRELLARNQKRARSIPPDVLEGMIQKLEPPAPWEAFEVQRSAGDGQWF
ncbi:MAG: AAA family ATPase, partial [Lachnospiraceae bacterium]|nr:AAA family ATPase [Lachnospiraceae bacterium]